jgi:hypothetical protein
MPVLESSDHEIAPRSILRHRPINEKKQVRKRSTTTSHEATTIPPRASRVRQTLPERNYEAANDELDEWLPILHAEDVEQEDQYASVTTAPHTLKKLPRTLAPTAKQHTSQNARTLHPLLYLGLGMLFMLLLWMAIMGVAGWFTNTLNTIRYGYPRTYQTDQFVGHNDSSGMPSHFIAINLHGHLEVIELPGGDAAHARIYEGPQLYSANADLVPVTLKFEDVNGDHKPDMLLCFQNSQVVFINAQGEFQPLTAAERPQVEQFLQRPGASCA